MAYKKKSFEDKQKEIEELTNKMTEQIESYFISEDALKEHLAFMSNFHNYSLRNTILIENQFMGAKAVGSFKFWQDKGISVQKGEKGIKILVPTPVEYFKRNEDWVQIKFANAKEKEQLKKGTLETQKKLFFKVGHVFEYTQTNAREKGMPVSEIFGQYHKDGIINNEKEMIAALHKVSEKVGFEILEEPPEELGTAKGVAFPYEKKIALNPRNTAYENVTTLIHELAHAKLHTPDVRDSLTRAEREFQAEMVSYVVANRYGIDTEDFSLSYLASWTQQGKELKDKERLLNGVKETASEFIDVIDNHFSKVQLKEKELEQQDIQRVEEKHQLKVTSLEGKEYRDSEEIAQLVMVNGVTGKEYTLSVWAGDIQNNELEPYYVYLNNPKELKDDDLTIEDSLFNALHDSTLSDVIKLSNEIEHSIEEYSKNENKTFSIEIPKEHQQFDLHSMIVDEEVAEILLKNEKGMVSKEDIINFGKLMEHDKENTFDLNGHLKESFEAILDKTGVKQDEIKHINSALNALNIDINTSHFSKNKPIEKPIEELELPF